MKKFWKIKITPALTPNLRFFSEILCGVLCVCAFLGRWFLFFEVFGFFWGECFCGFLFLFLGFGGFGSFEGVQKYQLKSCFYYACCGAFSRRKLLENARFGDSWRRQVLGILFFCFAADQRAKKRSLDLARSHVARRSSASCIM